jgi:hypothetical protein
LWRSRWNVDWQGKPKFSEKNCPSATFVHHKIPHDQTRVWTRATAVGSRRLTAWTMAWPKWSISFWRCHQKTCTHSPFPHVSYTLYPLCSKTFAPSQLLNVLKSQPLNVLILNFIIEI